jgi:hypothetical protein
MAGLTDAHRLACAVAFGVPGVTARRVVELAASGELCLPDGAPLDAFRVSERQVRGFARRCGGDAQTELQAELERARLADVMEVLRARALEPVPEIDPAESLRRAAMREYMEDQIAALGVESEGGA